MPAAVTHFPDCFLCEAARDPISPPNWYDAVLVNEAEVGLAVASVGQLVSGYLLVAPYVHVPSIAALSVALVPRFSAFVERVRAEITARYAEPTIFEHGGCTSASVSSACVEHAHLHLVPGRYELSAPAGAVSTTYHNLTTFMQSQDRRAMPYLLWEGPDGKITVATDAQVSQHFRRQIAEQIGERDAWDYAASPFFSRLRDTIITFRRPITARP
jgi:diadenosine tetraphosphate (Ap4A) HIT family hydrolase